MRQRSLVEVSAEISRAATQCREGAAAINRLVTENAKLRDTAKKLRKRIEKLRTGVRSWKGSYRVEAVVDAATFRNAVASLGATGSVRIMISYWNIPEESAEVCVGPSLQDGRSIRKDDTCAVMFGRIVSRPALSPDKDCGS